MKLEDSTPSMIAATGATTPCHLSLKRLAMTAACGLVAFAIPDAACGDMPGHVLIAETKTTNINGIKFSFLEAPRAVTDTGDVFYQGNYSAPGVSYASGFWRGSGNVVQALASRGMTAPGGGVFQDVVSFTAGPRCYAGGYAVFMAEFRLPPSTTGDLCRPVFS